MYIIKCSNCNKSITIYDNHSGKGVLFCSCGSALYYKDAEPLVLPQ
ncbi:hypothetical protein MCHI_002237 [Candidatus Magnetoovum chiemensis]|nr:hypothetical protein MCHI_002237 [Candidatus Magnetoovum chiemensis]